MLVGTASGNIGRDAETRQAGKDTVTSFSIATTHREGKENITVWVDASIWGKRGEALSKFLTKGSTVSCSGEIYPHEHNGKTYMKMKVDQLALLGGKRGDSSSRSNGSSRSNTDASSDNNDDDQIPF